MVTTLDEGHTRAGIIRERLLRGDPVNVKAVRQELGGSDSNMVVNQVRRLERAGHQFTRTKDGYSVVWQLEPSESPQADNGEVSPASAFGLASEMIRQRFTDGEALNAKDVATEYGRSESLMGLVMGSMRKKGSVFVKEKYVGRPRENLWRLKGARKKTASKAVVKAAPKPTVNGSTNGTKTNIEEMMVTFPTLASRPQVTGLAMDKQTGGVIMQLDDGETVWLVNITAVTSSEPILAHLEDF